MKFTCTKEHFQKALREVGNIAGRNPTLPILRHVLIRTERGRLRLSATDLEVGITTWVTGRVEKEGTTTIPLKQLAEYVTHLPEGHLNLAINDNTLVITCGPARASFQGETAENFPLIPSITKGNKFKIPAPKLFSAIDEVIYAAATEDTRPELSGILWEGRDKTLILAATDSYRLAESHVTLPAEVPDKFRVILPLRAVHELRRILEGEEDYVIVTLAEGQILTETPTTNLISRLIEGNYPDYKQIIPPKSPVLVLVTRQELLRAIRGASVFSYSEANSVLLETTSNTVRVTATAQEIGETVVEVPGEIHGNNVSISFNPRFLIDVLSAIPGERVKIELTNSSIPAVVRPESDKEKTLALVMPIKV